MAKQSRHIGRMCGMGNFLQGSFPVKGDPGQVPRNEFVILYHCRAWITQAPYR
jgi:hypothetical protein